ncbi:MAG: hypothetical protein K1X57_20575 [Gemmataceae bacterium]|nr:hypothetical protein [Gemmataceae bacterium]
MDPTSTPAFDFPVENPGLSFGFAGGSWVSPTVFQAKYNVADLNVSLPDIDVRVTGGKNLAKHFWKRGVG